MKGEDLMRAYFERRISAEDVRKQLANNRNREFRKLLKMRGVDVHGRATLSSLQPPEGAAERLAQRVASPEMWAELLERSRNVSSPAWRLDTLSPAFDVIGHERDMHRPAKKQRKAKTRSTAKKRKSR